MWWRDDIDWGATAAWAQAILSALAIFAAVWLQDRDRAKRREEQARLRLDAVLTIAESCVRTLRYLDKRARGGELVKSKFGFYDDETSAHLAAVTAVDLSQLEDPRVGTELIRLRRATTTARRRLGRDRDKVENGGVVTQDRYSSLLRQAREALRRLRCLRASHSRQSRWLSRLATVATSAQRSIPAAGRAQPDDLPQVRR